MENYHSCLGKLIAVSNLHLPRVVVVVLIVTKCTHFDLKYVERLCGIISIFIPAIQAILY